MPKHTLTACFITILVFGCSNGASTEGHHALQPNSENRRNQANNTSNTGNDSKRIDPEHTPDQQTDNVRNFNNYQPPTDYPTTPISNSLGTGGPIGVIDSNFSASNGLSSRYKGEVPADVHQKSYGLLIYLHGDNHGELGSYFFREFSEIGAKHGLIPIAVYSPNGGSKWWGGGGRYASLLNEFLSQKLAKEYNLDLDHTYFYGISGGSQFMTKYFAANYGHLYKGGMAPMCGGNSSSNTPVKQPDLVRNQLKFHFYTHQTDFLYGAVERTVNTYKNLNFDVTYESPSRGGHCKLDWHEKMDELLTKWKTN